MDLETPKVPERPRRRVVRSETVEPGEAVKSESDESGVELPPVPKTRPSRKPLAKSVASPGETATEKSVDEPVERPVVDVASDFVREASVKSSGEASDELHEVPDVSPDISPDNDLEETPEESLEEQIIDVFKSQTEDPSEVSAEDVSEELAEEFIGKSIDEPVEEPIEVSAENPVGKPVEESFEQPIEEPIEAPIAEPIEAPIAEPIEESIEEPIEAPIAEPIEEPAEELVAEPIGKTIEEPTEEPTEEPIVVERTQEPTIEKEVAPQTIRESSIPKEDSPDTQAKKKSGKAPPVPKKPSSKIAAFQQMFQQQQFQPERTPVVKDTSASKAGGFSGNRAQFAQNLNGMIALPGMAQFPPAFAKKLGVATSSDDNESTNDETKDTESEVALPEIPARSKRARGPAKRLPKTVASIEKVEVKSTSNIKVVKAWSISFKPDIKQKFISDELEPETEELAVSEELAGSEEPASGTSTDFEDSVEEQLQPETIKESVQPQLQIDTEPIIKAEPEQERTPVTDEQNIQEQQEEPGEDQQDDPVLDADESTPTAFIAEAYDEDTEVETPTT